MPNDWRLSYSGVALDLGSIASRYVFTDAPDLGSADILTDDAVRPRADGVAFGVDYLAGRTISLEIDVLGDDEADARSRLATLRGAWRADAVRQKAGATAVLRSDRARRTYGRPRRFASTDTLLPQGLAQVTADFACADDLWYADAEASVSVNIVPPAGGGLLSPLASPLATTTDSDRSSAFTVAGEVPTWPVFEIAGPITNPVVEVVGVLRMEFRTTLSAGQTIVVDTRPWARSILRNGASVAGVLSRTSTRLSRASIPVGTHEIVLRGASQPGTASARVRWRDAYLTP